METPEAFGIWALGDHNLISFIEEEPAEIIGKSVYCPFCKRRMKMWMEGCTLLHIECKGCNFCLTMKTENRDIYEKLLRVIYE